MKKLLPLGICILIMLASIQSFAQSAGTYSFSAFAGTFTPITGGTAVNEILADSKLSNTIPIGFNFEYEGISYAYCKASSNSFLQFDTTQLSSRTTNDLDGVNEPILAPIWDDNDGRATGGSSASYVTTGTAPNRVFTMEWLNWEWRYNSTTPTISYQVKLYEGTNVIEFIYRQESGTVSSGTASIGLCGLGTGAGTFLSLADASASPSVSSGTETSNISTKPATGQIYSFTPPSCFAPSNLRDSMVLNTSATIKFDANFSSLFYNGTYGISGSGSTIPFSSVTASSGSTTFILTGLTPGTSYDVAVRVACAPGDTSAYVNHTFTTAYPSPIQTDFTGFTGSNLSSSSPGWSESNGNPLPSGTTSSWTISNTTQQTHFGVPSAKINLYTSSRDEWIISPRVVVNAGDIFRCKVAVTDYNSAGADVMGSDDSVKIYISNNGGASWTMLRAFTAADNLSNSFTNYSTNLTAYVGQAVQVAIYAQDGPINDIEDYDFHVTDVYVGGPISNNDVGVTAIIEPTGGCGDDSTEVKVAVYNYGALTQTNFGITAMVSGSVTGTLTATVASLDSNITDTISLGYINTISGGLINISAYTTLTGDQDVTNDTSALSGIQMDAIPAAPTVSNVSACSGTNTFIVASGGLDAYTWYNANAPSTAIHTGDTLFLNNVTANETYEVSGYNLTSELVGPSTPPTGSYLSNNAGRGTGFDVLADAVIIDSVTVYPIGTGWMVMRVTSYDGSVVYHTADTVFFTGANNLTPTRVPVNLTVPYGVGIYKMTMLYSGITGMGRNSQSYPFSTSGNEFSIIGGATGTGSPTSSNNYWFYNWRVSIPGCKSPRTTATLTVNANPIVNLGNDTTLCGASAVNLTLDAGNSGSNYLWSNGATSQTTAVTATGTYTVTVTTSAGCTGTDAIVVSQSTPISASITSNNVSCNGGSDGSVSTSAAGGQSPYTYLWSNSATTANITGLTAGAYTVTITDNAGCTGTGSATITEPTAIVTSLNSTNVSCNGLSDGTISTNTSGGTSPYTYLWSVGSTNTNLTNLIAGTYTVTVTDANGCTNAQSLSITQPAALVASAVIDSNVTCNGFTDGGSTASASGGTAPYTYTWSNSATTASITGVASGAYTVTITDNNGCTDSSSVTISQPQIPTGSITAAACSSYTWASNGISYTASGTYLDTVSTSGACDSIITLNLTINTVDTTVTQVSDSLYANMSGATYQWIDCNNGNAPISGATAKGFRPAVSGSYAVIVSNGACTETSSCFTVIKTGIEDVQGTAASFNVFPNPSEGELRIQYSGNINPNETIFIYDMNGKLVFQSPLRSSNEVINLYHLENGLYLMRYEGSITKVIINK